MVDSCRLRWKDPGLAAMYSNPSDLITSTMKSDPARTGGSSPESFTVTSDVFDEPCWAAIEVTGETSPAAPVTAATCRNSRRFFLVMTRSSSLFIWFLITQVAESFVVTLNFVHCSADPFRDSGDLTAPPEISNRVIRNSLKGFF